MSYLPADFSLNLIVYGPNPAQTNQTVSSNHGLFKMFSMYLIGVEAEHCRMGVLGVGKP